MRYRDAGASMSPQWTLAPQALAAAANGSSVDRLPSGNTYNSGKLTLKLGATTGTPTSFTVDCKLQHSPDDSTWADYSEDGTVVSLTQLTAANGTASANVRLEGADRYVRAVVTPAFTGGTTPTVLACVCLVLSGAAEEPVS